MISTGTPFRFFCTFFGRIRHFGNDACDVFDGLEPKRLLIRH
jgi:hypothetical protein